MTQRSTTDAGDAGHGLGTVAAKRPILVLSVLAHLGLGISIGGIELRSSQAATAIEIAETSKQSEPPKAKLDPEPASPEHERPRVRRVARAAPQKAVEPAPAPKADAVLDALPDFGLSLSSGNTGPGLALPVSGRRAVAANAPSVQRALSAAAKGAVECEEQAKKPRPRIVPRPSYSDAARLAGVEGKVRVELTVDETGRVVSVRLLTSLGYGLDEAALAAARAAEFDPALRCGKPARATFVISMRFTAG